MNEMGYVSQQEVEQILAWNLAIDAEQKAIETFKVQWQATQQHHKSLSEETKGLRYDVEIHQQLLADIATLQNEINTLQAEAGALRGRQLQLEKDLATQADLLKEKEALEIRRADIDTLAKLFKSQGFVGFVSGMYLQNLCNQANERFSKMTRQALQLEIYETRPSEFDFRVRDLLNEGRTRAVKTLSGGQKFQVALCLALALADNIHAQTQSTNNFFFLDEGFGSLDKDSLTEVFETLKSLRKENRIVGVISHVEDLQQEIESYITVENHPEMGSQIKC
jgi:exonuclease SbcC